MSLCESRTPTSLKLKDSLIFQLIHGPGFNDNDKVDLVPDVYDNIFDAMTVLARQIEEDRSDFLVTSEFKSIGSKINIFTAGSKLLLTNNILRLCNDEQFSSIYISFTIFARSCQIASAVLCIDKV